MNQPDFDNADDVALLGEAQISCRFLIAKHQFGICSALSKSKMLHDWTGSKPSLNIAGEI